MIGAGPRLGLGLGHRLVESVDALALAQDEVRLGAARHPRRGPAPIMVHPGVTLTFITQCRSLYALGIVRVQQLAGFTPGFTLSTTRANSISALKGK